MPWRTIILWHRFWPLHNFIIYVENECWLQIIRRSFSCRKQYLFGVFLLVGLWSFGEVGTTHTYTHTHTRTHTQHTYIGHMHVFLYIYTVYGVCHKHMSAFHSTCLFPGVQKKGNLTLTLNTMRVTAISQPNCTMV